MANGIVERLQSARKRVAEESCTVNPSGSRKPTRHVPRGPTAKAGHGPAVPYEIASLYRCALKTSNMGTGPPLVTTLGITPFHFATARP